MMITLKPEASTILIVEPSKLNSRLLGKETEATTATKFHHLDKAANHVRSGAIGFSIVIRQKCLGIKTNW